MNRRLFLAAAVLPAASQFRAQAADKTAALDAAIENRRLAEAVRLFGNISKPTARDQYLAGVALMALNRPTDARLPLVGAKAAGFVSWPGWPTVDALLARVHTLEALAPPQRAITDVGNAIMVHAGPYTRWSAAVLAAMPEFVAVGRTIFGADLPAIRMYLFSERPPYERFYHALFGIPTPTAWEQGVGGTNVAVLCAVDGNGRTLLPAGTPDSLGLALHELAHGWIATYVMRLYDREWLSVMARARWLDEGLAECIAALREPDYLRRREVGLKRKAAAGVPAPSFEKLATHAGFFESGDFDARYWLAALFVNELLGPSDKAPATIRRILDEIGRTGSAAGSVQRVAGRDLRKTFDEVVRRYWGATKS